MREAFFTADDGFKYCSHCGQRFNGVTISGRWIGHDGRFLTEEEWDRIESERKAKEDRQRALDLLPRWMRFFVRRRLGA